MRLAKEVVNDGDQDSLKGPLYVLELMQTRDKMLPINEIKWSHAYQLSGLGGLRRRPWHGPDHPAPGEAGPAQAERVPAFRDQLGLSVRHAACEHV
jgi:hypothetical protein